MNSANGPARHPVAFGDMAIHFAMKKSLANSANIFFAKDCGMSSGAPVHSPFLNCIPGILKRGSSPKVLKIATSWIVARVQKNFSSRNRSVSILPRSPMHTLPSKEVQLPVTTPWGNGASPIPASSFGVNHGIIIDNTSRAAVETSAAIRLKSASAAFADAASELWWGSCHMPAISVMRCHVKRKPLP